MDVIKQICDCCKNQEAEIRFEKHITSFGNIINPKNVEEYWYELDLCHTCLPELFNFLNQISTWYQISDLKVELNNPILHAIIRRLDLEPIVVLMHRMNGRIKIKES